MSFSPAAKGPYFSIQICAEVLIYSKKENQKTRFHCKIEFSTIRIVITYLYTKLKKQKFHENSFSSLENHLQMNRITLEYDYHIALARNLIQMNRNVFLVCERRKKKHLKLFYGIFFI